MVEWISDNKEKFEYQTLLAFTTKDSDLDTWLTTIDNNCTPEDEFALFALCQMYTRHALIVTSSQIWTTVTQNISWIIRNLGETVTFI